MKNIREKVGKRIRALRKAKNFTQEVLGEKAGISYKFIGEIERGQVNPSLDTLSAIANALNVDIGEFFQKEKSIFRQLPPQDLKIIKQALNILTKIFSREP
ncbi:MAG: helix-turn-helix domain-containing protein [bacterium]